MAQDKYIKKHQEILEKMREEVREQKMDILSKVDIKEIIKNPVEHLDKIGEDFYNSNEKKLRKAFSSGKKLAGKILKGLKK